MGITHKAFHYHLPRDRFYDVAAAATQQNRFRIVNPQAQFDFLNGELKETAYLGRDARTIEIFLEITWKGDAKEVYGSIKVDDRKRDKQEEFLDKLKASLDALASQKMQKIAEAPPLQDYGSARFATIDDLAKVGYLTSEIHPRRFIVAKCNGQYLALTEEDTNKHAYVCGPQGSGKSSGFFIPNIILRSRTSMVITEATATSEPNPDPQLFKDTAGARASSGSTIYSFNPANLYSTRINPIDVVRNAPEAEKANEAAKIANLISSNSRTMNSGDAEFWQTSERQLFTALILHVAAEDPKFANFRTIRNMLSRGAENLLEIIHESASPIALQEYAAFVNNTNEGFAKGVAQGVMTRLAAWLTPAMVTLTSQSDFTAENLKNEVFTFYLSVPGDRTDLKPIAALVLNYLMQMALSNTANHPVTFLLDEFTNFGYIPGFAERISLVRKTGTSICLGFQDVGQVYKVYRNDEAPIILSQPGTRIFLRPNDLRSAEYISNQLGPMTIVERYHNHSGQEETRTKKRDLMLPSEVQALADSKAIVFTVKTQHGLLIDKFPWQEFAAQHKIKPPERALHTIDQEVLNKHAITPEEARNLKRKPGKNAAREQAPQNQNQQPEPTPEKQPSRKSSANYTAKEAAQHLINALRNNPDKETVMAIYELLDELSRFQEQYTAQEATAEHTTTRPNTAEKSSESEQSEAAPVEQGAPKRQRTRTFKQPPELDI